MDAHRKLEVGPLLSFVTSRLTGLRCAQEEDEEKEAGRPQNGGGGYLAGQMPLPPLTPNPHSQSPAVGQGTRYGGCFIPRHGQPDLRCICTFARRGG